MKLHEWKASVQAKYSAPIMLKLAQLENVRDSLLRCKLPADKIEREIQQLLMNTSKLSEVRNDS